MLAVDLDQFWKDDQLAHKDNCFNSDSPQVALGIRMSDECVFAELGEEGKQWGYTPRERRIELNKRYNDKAEKIVGKRLLREDFGIEDARHPKIKAIGEIFDGVYEQSDNSPWLHSYYSTPRELEKVLDKVEKMNIREFMLPDNWESEKKRIYETYGKRPGLLRHVRGPVTLAMSLYGEENLIFLIYDYPDLAKRFSKVIGDVILEMGKIMDEEAGYSKGEAPHGFSFADDNCALLTPEMYELFGYPVLKRVFNYWSPNINDRRYQHSDSAMGHLIPILSTLNLTGCNFGPTVLVDQIRKNMKTTRIDGCLAPFTFMRNNEKDIIGEVKRDCTMAKDIGCKGLNISTAGSTNNGSSLESMRTVMYAIQNYGRY